MAGCYLNGIYQLAAYNYYQFINWDLKSHRPAGTKIHVVSIITRHFPCRYMPLNIHEKTNSNLFRVTGYQARILGDALQLSNYLIVRCHMKYVIIPLPN